MLWDGVPEKLVVNHGSVLGQSPGSPTAVKQGVIKGDGRLADCVRILT
jgi:hypothetical protein